jgi:4a-hydroxytetrahydrobiopterin dehydratase
MTVERRKLSGSEITGALEDLSGWQVKNGRLSKTFKFGTFAQAIGWMVTAGIYADKLDHHPDWSNVYNKVMVELYTHDLDALSTWDVALAQHMNQLSL